MDYDRWRHAQNRVNEAHKAGVAYAAAWHAANDERAENGKDGALFKELEKARKWAMFELGDAYLLVYEDRDTVDMTPDRIDMLAGEIREAYEGYSAASAVLDQALNESIRLIANNENPWVPDAPNKSQRLFLRAAGKAFADAVAEHRQAESELEAMVRAGPAGTRTDDFPEAKVRSDAAADARSKALDNLIAVTLSAWGTTEGVEAAQQDDTPERVRLDLDGHGGDDEVERVTAPEREAMRTERLERQIVDLRKRIRALEGKPPLPPLKSFARRAPRATEEGTDDG